MNMKKELLALIAVLFMVCSSAESRLGIGLNYPGIGIRYEMSYNSLIELKGQFGSDITLAGLRGYYNLKQITPTKLFAGIEADYITFKGEKSEGSGYAAEIFFGGEYFLTSRLALQLDLGPAFISLTDKKTSVKQDGIEVVVNIGINYYFGGE